MSPFHSARDHLLAAVDVIRDGRDIDSGLDDARCKMGKDLTLDELDLLMRDKLSGSGSTETSLVSLGDLGRKDIRHEPGDAGTTLSFTLARDYLESFDVPYGVITGNHDLEGLDEFDTDEEVRFTRGEGRLERSDNIISTRNIQSSIRSSPSHISPTHIIKNLLLVASLLATQRRTFPLSRQRSPTLT